jgi:uncharacterized lipoprotein YmbA
LLRTERIVAYPWPPERKPTYWVDLEVYRFANGARDAQLSARWTVIDESGKKPAIVKESYLARPAKEKSTDATVAALSETIADLSRQIADTIRSMNGQNNP